MKKSILLVLCLALTCTALFAQNAPYIRENQKGDQAVKIGLTGTIPVQPDTTKLAVGGAASLGYDYYLSRNLFVGGEISFVYNKTVGDNVFYYVPVLFNATWQLDAGKLEIPCTLGLGFALQNYTNNMFLGLDIRPQVGMYYRLNSEWSLGGSLLVHVLPEWFPLQPEQNYVKVLGGIQAGARYHF